MGEFTSFQGGLEWTSYRADVEIIPAALHQFPLNKWGNGYEFTDGTYIFTVYVGQGFSSDPEVFIDWDSGKPTKLRLGASLSTPKSDVERFRLWIEALSHTYEATK